MRIRRAIALLAANIVALLLALALPIAQVRTVTIVPACCCPSPTLCHCPDHVPVHGTQPVIRACHRAPADADTPPLTAFAAPSIVAIDLPARAISIEPPALGAPHDPPPPARPAAPS